MRRHTRDTEEEEEEEEEEVHQDEKMLRIYQGLANFDGTGVIRPPALHPSEHLSPIYGPSSTPTASEERLYLDDMYSSLVYKTAKVRKNSSTGEGTNPVAEDDKRSASSVTSSSSTLAGVRNKCRSASMPITGEGARIGSSAVYRRTLGRESADRGRSEDVEESDRRGGGEAASDLSRRPRTSPSREPMVSDPIDSLNLPRRHHQRSRSTSGGRYGSFAGKKGHDNDGELASKKIVLGICAMDKKTNSKAMQVRTSDTFARESFHPRALSCFRHGRARVLDPHRSPPPPLTDEILKPIQALTEEMWPGVPVLPRMVAGGTDGRFLTPAGIPTYGDSGLFTEPGEVNAHGLNEKVLVKSLLDSRLFLDRLVKIFAAQEP